MSIKLATLAAFFDELKKIAALPPPTSLVGGLEHASSLLGGLKQTSKLPSTTKGLLNTHAADLALGRAHLQDKLRLNTPGVQNRLHNMKMEDLSRGLTNDRLALSGHSLPPAVHTPQVVHPTGTSELATVPPPRKIVSEAATVPPPRRQLAPLPQASGYAG